MFAQLFTALLVLAVAWSSWAVFGPAGVVVCAIVFTLALLLWHPCSVWECAIVVLIFVILIALLVPAMQSARECARRAQCANNLKQLALALFNYEQTYGCFPPAYIADKDGKPMHSWRVLILPFVDEQGIYDQYDFNEPWDGPNNRKLLEIRPREYVCPSDANALAKGAITTSYVAVVGKNAAWHSGESLNLNSPEMRGHAADSIMLIESSDSGIQWSEPKDFSLDELTAASEKYGPIVHGPHTRSNGFFYHDTSAGGYVARANGSVVLLHGSNPSPKKLQRLFAIGGADENRPDFSLDDEPLRINWFNCTALAIWCASVGLLLFWAAWNRQSR